MLGAIKTLIRNALKWASSSRQAPTPPLPRPQNSHGGVETVNDVLSDQVWAIADQPRGRAELTALSELSSGQRSLAAPYSMLKPSDRNPQFYARQDIMCLMDEALLPKGRLDQGTSLSAGREFAICGLGGVGKTELAREYAFSRQDRFDAVFWIDSEHDSQLSEGFDKIASRLGYADTSVDRVLSRTVAREWLSNPTKRSGSNHRHRDRRPLELGGASMEEGGEEASWLLVFNNADDLKLLEDYWPTTQKGSVILTSRDPMAKHQRAGIDLEPLKQEDTAGLLRLLTRANSPQDMQASSAIAERLGGLPLAITQIAAHIDRWGMTLEEFLRFFDRQTSIKGVAEAKDVSKLGFRHHYKHSLLTVWTLEKLSRQGLALLEVLSFLSPDSITESLINPSSISAGDGAPPMLLDGFPTTEDEYFAARLDLRRVSLIRRAKGDSKLTLHRLVQDVVRSQMDSARAVRVLELTASLVLKAWPTGFLRFDHDTATWNSSEELLPHILKLQIFFRRRWADVKSADARQNFARLLLFAGW
ncbi:P-loop containing nucleoside triphosphate hydrolase protein [Lasiosphaeris hirsuta]|uniref:P-loop containing nucleoside triphosphate hydrolase protein n=1 Tax=Lasiosphaeris hirsuta TaxID=260670 RepID=A0AA40AGI8_9PEZI|nr:P-loop containing nucleoside triphosphate hydrolase protein [Lasiosphaeris hirsuta]